MGDRAPFVVGVLAIVAVVAWLVLRGDSTPPSNPTPATNKSDAPGAAGRAKIAAPEGPSLGSATRPELPPLPASPTADQVFADEDRDDAWAPKAEAELAKRWKQIRAGKLESTECRQTQCRLVITGSQDDVATAIADLEGPRGLHGYAQNVLLTSPSKNADGTIALRIYARFDR